MRALAGQQQGRSAVFGNPLSSRRESHRVGWHMYRTVEELVAAVSKGERVKYLFFWGHTSTRDSVGAECLSQWYEAPFVVDGVHYRTAEHHMPRMHKRAA